jgi:hypothetical protein
MSLLRLLGIQGIAGIAVSLALGLLLIVQRGETRHWKTKSGRFEQLYAGERAALAETIANYRAAAADAARAADQANVARVAAEQRAINERTSNDYEARLAAARTLARSLRGQAPSAAADPGAGGAASLPRLPAPAGGADETAGEDRLPDPDRLLATEQAIQLDELIEWVKAQARVDPSSKER